MKENMEELAKASLVGMVALKQRNDSIQRQVSLSQNQRPALVNQQVIMGVQNNQRFCVVRKQVVGLNVHPYGYIDEESD